MALVMHPDCHETRRMLWGKGRMFERQDSLRHPEMSLMNDEFPAFRFDENGDYLFICTVIPVPYKMETCFWLSLFLYFNMCRRVFESRVSKGMCWLCGMLSFIVKATIAHLISCCVARAGNLATTFPRPSWLKDSKLKACMWGLEIGRKAEAEIVTFSGTWKKLCLQWLHGHLHWITQAGGPLEIASHDPYTSRFSPASLWYLFPISLQ